MADKIQTLLVSLEARIAGYEREMRRANGVANTSARSIESRFATMNKNVSRSFSGIGAGIAQAFAGAAALRGAQQLIDASIGIENSLKVAGLAGEDLSAVYDKLFASAQRNYAPIEALTTLYGRAAAVQNELGASSEDLIKFTDNIAVALRVNGKSAAESSGALMQLGQALGSARVQAEEFNSINEGARPILQAAAAGILEAGGSVSKLKALVNDGKISNQAFFQGIQAGSVILEDKLVGAEASVSQSFIRLRNVLIDVAGDFNSGTGASASFATSLDQLGTAIQGIGKNEDFNRFLEMLSDFGNQSFAGTVKEFEAIGGAVSSVRDAFTNVNAEVDITLGEMLAAQQAMEAFASANGAVFSSEVEGAFRDLIIQLVEGKGSADSARAAIMAMGTADPNFDRVIGQVDILVSTFIRLREAADAALRTATQSPVPSGGFAGQDRAPPQKTTGVKPITAADYPVIGGAGDKKSGGSKQSSGEKFEDVLKKQAEENRLLAEKTTLQASLNPLIEDYGFALEKLNVEQELLSAATKAGIELTPALKTQINDLATGYANASVEAKKLAESQEQVKQIAADFGEAGSSAIKGFISDLREGKSGAEALSNALNSVLDKVIDIGLNMLLGGGGGGLFAGIGKLFGFASGGYTGDGGKNQPAGVVHKGEYVFTKAQTERLGVGNLSRLAKGYANGGYVGAPGPVTAQGGSSGGSIAVSVSIDVQNGNLVPTITQVAGQVAGQQIKSNNKQLPNLMADYNMRQG